MVQLFRRAIPIATIAVAVACSSSSSSPPPAPNYSGSCAALASRCHGSGTPLGKECHDLGHDGDESKCGPRKAECLEECPEHADGDHDDAAAPTDSDGGLDAAAADASDGAVDPCTAYCACMKTACSTVFADDNACLAACAAFSAADRACFAVHCEDAKTAPDPKHDCEHASGDVACH